MESPNGDAKPTPHDSADKQKPPDNKKSGGDVTFGTDVVIFAKKHPFFTFAVVVGGTIVNGWAGLIRVEQQKLKVGQAELRADRAEDAAEEANKTLAVAKIVVGKHIKAIRATIVETIGQLEFDPPEATDKTKRTLLKPIDQLSIAADEWIFESVDLDSKDGPADPRGD